MMEADIAGEPLKQFGKLNKRTAFQGYGTIIPIVSSEPGNILELVLHIEQIQSSDGRNIEDQQLNNKEINKPDSCTHDDTKQQQRGICKVNIDLLLLGHCF